MDYTDEKMEGLVEALKTDRPAKWEEIPDIDLYKDQLTEYLKRQHIGFALGVEEPLTSAMINNYIKVGVLPRAKGKRYGREHIAYLTAVALLKQVLPIQETGELIGEQISDGDVKGFYGRYLGMLDEALTKTAEKLNSKEDARELALRLAVESYADKLLCRELIQMLGE